MQSYNAKKRPVIELPWTTSEKILEFIGILALCTSFFLLARYWSVLPEKIPTHFNFAGKPDGWGGKESLFILPVLGTFMYIIMKLLSKYPQIYNYPVEITEANAAFQYLLGRKVINWLRTLVVILFGYLEWNSINVALGNSAGLGSWFIFAVLTLTFIPPILYIMKARANKT